MSTAAVLVGEARWHVEQADCLAWLGQMPAGCVQCCATSPPYFGLRDYQCEGQLGLEPTPAEYATRLVEVFREVRRVLRSDGTLWLNLGDSYHAGKTELTQCRADAGFQPKQSTNSQAGTLKRKRLSGFKPKDLLGIPWRVAFALQADGWYLRSDIIWHKPSPMPESVTDRPTKAHEYVFLLTKSARYYYDAEAIKEKSGFEAGTIRRAFTSPRATAMGRNPSGNEVDGWVTETGGRNKRSVWTIASQGYSGAHFATFPPALVEPMILAGSSERGCCPQCGAPWWRVVTRDRQSTSPGRNTKVSARAEDAPTDGTSGEYSPDGRAQFRSSAEIGNRDPQRHCTKTTMVGWEPSCKCGSEEPIGCLILDPFAGAATTGLVAQRLGRRFLGCELNPTYAEMGRQRLRDDMPLFQTEAP